MLTILSTLWLFGGLMLGGGPSNTAGLTYPPPLLDDFNRADGAVGAAWLPDLINEGSSSTLVITGNQATRSGGTTEGTAAWSTVTSGPHQLVCATFISANDGTGIMLYARVNAPDSASMTGYSLLLRRQADADDWEFYEWASATRAQLGGDISVEVTAGDSVCLDVNGDTLTALHNGSSIGTRTDATIADGDYIGMGIQNAANRADDFRGGSE